MNKIPGCPTHGTDVMGCADTCPDRYKKKTKKSQVFSSDLEKMWPWGKKEQQFHVGRKWAFDWSDREHNVAVELDGYVYHTMRSRWLEDMEKMNEAMVDGWIVLHITPDQFRNGEADALLRRLYETIFGRYPRDAS